MRRVVTASAGLVLSLVGCLPPTADAGPVADVLGTWDYSGQQTAPALDLTGVLVIESQDGATISGRLSWEERDAGGGLRSEAAPVSGRVIESSDIDFDVLGVGGDRRHVARLTAGAMDGTWVQVQALRSGTFTATRRP